MTQHNKGLYNALRCTSAFMKISSPAVSAIPVSVVFPRLFLLSFAGITTQDMLWSSVLSSPSMCSNVIQTNQRQMTETLRYCQEFFHNHDIPIVQPAAAQFIWSTSSRRYSQFRNITDMLIWRLVDLSKYWKAPVDGQTPHDRDKELFSAFFKSGLYIAPGMLRRHNSVC